MASKIQGAQTDFSSGEVDISLKRSDAHPARKTGLRQMSNMRILNSGAIQNRPGRRALFPLTGTSRVEDVLMSPGNLFKVCFAAGSVVILTSTGTLVKSFSAQGNGAALPWDIPTLNQIVYAQFNLSIYITFPGMRPQVIVWNGQSGWSLVDFLEAMQSNQKRTPFYRISRQGVTLFPSAASGNITLTSSETIFTPQHVGTRVRYVDRQILITGYTDALNVSATVEEVLPGSQAIGFADNSALPFSEGDVVVGSLTGSKGIITHIDPATGIRVQLITANTSTQTVGTVFSQTTVTLAFTVDDVVVGPGGSLKPTSVTSIQTPQAVTYWDDEVMNDMRGYPASVFTDQFRLGFCNFESVPNGIAWSAINSPTDLYVDSQPDNAIFELAPDKVQVYYVVPGAESSEFVFCDRKLYYIKIDPSNPLVPGSVGFQTLSSDGCARVQPRASQEAILYANAGRNSIMAIVSPGNYYRPFNTKNLCDSHNHLFDGIAAIAIPTADGTFNERYAYVMNGDGSLVVGKYSIQDGQIGGTVGWGPWSGVGAVKWVSAFAADVLFTAEYYGATICEVLDDDQYLDGTIESAHVPTPFLPPAGKGVMWWIPSQTVSLIDQDTRMMGVYQVDPNGFIIHQNNAGEDFSSTSLVFGQPWTAIAEPFCPDATSGADMHQRMTKRRIARFAAYVINSSGFVMGRLFSARDTPYSPSPGTLMNFRRFSAWAQGDDPTKPPPLRETTESIRPPGRSYDPRVAIIKDTPGPLLIAEMSVEATI